MPAFGAWPDVALLVAKDWEAVGIKTVVQVRERALHFKMGENNELMAEIWNEDTSAFPYTGNAKADPRNNPILTTGPLWRRWYATGGKEGVEEARVELVGEHGHGHTQAKSGRHESTRIGKGEASTRLNTGIGDLVR